MNKRVLVVVLLLLSVMVLSDGQPNDISKLCKYLGDLCMSHGACVRTLVHFFA